MSGLGEFDIDEETSPYVESFKKWWHQGHEVICIEKRFWDDELKLTGQVDLILKTDKGLAILDLKTSSAPSKTWESQGNAYAYLAKKSGYNIERIMFLHLNKNGKEPKIYEYPIDPHFFLSIHSVYIHFFHRLNHE